MHLKPGVSMPSGSRARGVREASPGAPQGTACLEQRQAHVCYCKAAFEPVTEGEVEEDSCSASCCLQQTEGMCGHQNLPDDYNAEPCGCPSQTHVGASLTTHQLQCTSIVLPKLKRSGYRFQQSSDAWSGNAVLVVLVSCWALVARTQCL